MIYLQNLELATYDGVLIWKINDYKKRKQEAVRGRQTSLYSHPFYSSKTGYKMCCRVGAAIHHQMLAPVCSPRSFIIVSTYLYSFYRSCLLFSTSHYLKLNHGSWFLLCPLPMFVVSAGTGCLYDVRSEAYSLHCILTFTMMIDKCHLVTVYW